MDNEKYIWDFLLREIGNPYGVAGLMGNLKAESDLRPNNLQDSYEHILGISDDAYLEAVDNGVYTNFVGDAAGWGIAQWTHFVRKERFYLYCKSKKASIGDLHTQLEFLIKELKEYFSGVFQDLKSATSVRDASNAVLLRFECPRDSGIAVQNRRAEFSQAFYNKYSVATPVEVKKSMGYIIVKKGQNKKLSEHFDSIEFDCHGSGCCSETKINEQLLVYLEKIREHFGKSITITSAYRCERHNRNVGGATGSRHSKGDATDIVVSGVAPREVAKYAESIGIHGIGLYETSADGHFVHIDTREKKSFWYGQACAYRSTFGGTAMASGGIVTVTPAVTTDASTTASPTLSLGSYGAAVKVLQENLIKLGYSCGRMGADGAYGAGTAQAVREFQRKAGLKVDGYAGALTQAAIQKALGNQDTTTVSPGAEHSKEYNVTVTASVLNVRKGAGVNHQWIGSVRWGEVCTIVEEATGADGNTWGKMKSGGWISLIYTVRV